MRIGVIGTGYVGLVVGACFAETGNDVVCVDQDASKVAALLRGEIPIYEPGLADLLPRNLNGEERRLRFTTDLAEAVKISEVIFIAVGTPQDEDGSADLSSVLAVAEEIARSLDGWRVIVLKSTVPVGTAKKVRAAMSRLTEQPFGIASNP